MAGQSVSRWGKNAENHRLGVLISEARFGLKLTVSCLRTLI